jgi:hypothetical protein
MPKKHVPLYQDLDTQFHKVYIVEIGIGGVDRGREDVGAGRGSGSVGSGRQSAHGILFQQEFFPLHSTNSVGTGQGSTGQRGVRGAQTAHSEGAWRGITMSEGLHHLPTPSCSSQGGHSRGGSSSHGPEAMQPPSAPSQLVNPSEPSSAPSSS